MSYGESRVEMALPRPGRVLRVVLIALFAIWLAFAVGINWAGASEEAFWLFCGSTERILQGEVWRLFTAPLMHWPTQIVSHIVSALLGLYFLAPSLEERWGGARFARFLFFSGVIAYGLQMALELVLPLGVSAKLVGDYWFGAIPVVEAVAIAWALSFRGQVVRLFFVLPVSSRGLIVFVVGSSVLYVIAAAQSPSGLIAPFGGMLAGWLLGGSSPSPLRRFWLKIRLAQLDAEARREAGERRKRIERSNLRVLGDRPGERRDDDESGPRGGGWLN